MRYQYTREGVTYLYEVVDFDSKMKHPDGDAWLTAVIYIAIDGETNTLFTREKKDFLVKFEKVEG